MKICVVIPCYNVADKIEKIIREINTHGLDVVVIDDGSIDGTDKVISGLEADLIKNASNLGKGVSLRMGFDYALKNNYDGLITMDGDGQHAPSDIPLFLEFAQKFQAGIIAGNRMANPRNMPFIRWLTNRFMSKYISRICGQLIPDSQCGFRFIGTECLKRMTLRSERFEIESEILVEAARNGCKIESVCITSIYNNSISGIKPFCDTVRFLRFIMPYCRTAGRFFLT